MGAFRRAVRHEAVLFSSIWLLLRGRKDVPDGGVALPYAGPQRPMIVVFLVVSLVETGAFLLVDFGPVGDALLLLAEVYTAAWLLGTLAAGTTRPHVVSADELRVRAFAQFDLRLPRADVESFTRRTENHASARTLVWGAEELVMPQNMETNVVVRLHRPVAATRPLGGTEKIRVLKLFVEDPAFAVRAFDGTA
ncbi:hypothetical protein H4696_006536 [Amycolatopsis lexingtonensis]|uniref:Integral membrane protein n=1 Tax=Amycolatopsis lexingtonensis TaxID=218822 RepID=A0ABR9I8F7_9PSEU|nr:hypothetical protein [Amycolatopsis lexingtonensis]MBE1499436.1 hypothetical protein [Amycolatopsis lexingtonensis]